MGTKDLRKSILTAWRDRTDLVEDRSDDDFVRLHLFATSKMLEAESTRVCPRFFCSSSWGMDERTLAMPTWPWFASLLPWLSFDFMDSLRERAEVCSLTVEGLRWIDIWFCIKVELGSTFGEVEEVTIGVAWKAASDSIDCLLVFAPVISTNWSLPCCAMMSKLKQFCVRLQAVVGVLYFIFSDF